jgi:RecG-like helicase
MAGTRQSGMPEFRIANLMLDGDLLSLAQREAQRWAERSGERERLIEALSARTRFVTVG